MHTTTWAEFLNALRTYRRIDINTAYPNRPSFRLPESFRQAYARQYVASIARQVQEERSSTMPEYRCSCGDIHYAPPNRDDMLMAERSTGFRGWRYDESPYEYDPADMDDPPFDAPHPPAPQYRERARDDFRLHSYSYTPELEFRGDGPAFYGMEVEVSCDSRAAMSRINDVVSDICWMKHDGSVDGFEMVTHPMTYPWAKSNFPWDAFDTMEEEGCYIEPDTNGIHVHVARDGFSSPAHTYRWMKFFYRNANDIRRIARRDCHWGSFTNDHRRGHLAHVNRMKFGKIMETWYNGANHSLRAGHITRKEYDNWFNYRRYPRIIRKASEAGNNDPTTYMRYNAINTGNPNTLEVRVFASTLDKTVARSALELCASTVEYTRGLTAHDVCKRDGWSWNAYREWLKASEYDAMIYADETARRSRRASATF